MQLFEEFLWLRFLYYYFVFQGERGFAGSKGEEGEKVSYSVHVIFSLMFRHMANQVELCSEGLP